MGVGIKWVDKGLRAVFGELDKMAKEKPYVSVGIPASKRVDSKTGLTNGQVAIVMEFGLKGGSSDLKHDIPARPFIGPTITENKRKYLYAVRKSMKLLVTNRPHAEYGLKALGARVVNDIREAIKSNIPPRNSKYTLERKNGTRTLIDTGQMMAAVTYKLMKGDK